MYYFENIFSALDAIRTNKLRSSLTMLGIMIGVASVVLMVAIGRGAQQSVTDRIQSMGTNLLIIQPGSPTQSNVRSMFSRSGGGSSSSLTITDADAIAQFAHNIKGISPEVRSSMQVIYGNLNMSTSIVGVTPDYTEVNNFPMEFGSFITSEDLLSRNKVVVLGQEIVNTLFNGQNPIGEDIRLENNIFTVVGVMSQKGQQGFSNQDDIAFIPLTTMQQRIQGSDSVNTINVSVTSQDKMEQTKELITAILMNEHRIPNSEDQDFNVLNQSEVVETLNEITQIFTLLLGGIAAISLLVGGIGVMNIMLVSVTERTREIGIRKAIGARKRDILQQFLVESTVLTILGGIVGILLSLLGVWLVSTFSEITAIISTSSIILAVAFSITIGVFFGMLPAWKAAKLKPIDALRYE